MTVLQNLLGVQLDWQSCPAGSNLWIGLGLLKQVRPGPRSVLIIKENTTASVTALVEEPIPEIAELSSHAVLGLTHDHTLASRQYRKHFTKKKYFCKFRAIYGGPTSNSQQAIRSPSHAI